MLSIQSMVDQPLQQDQSTTSTKKSILIKPDNQFDFEDFILLGRLKGGAKFRKALIRLAQKYNFKAQDYKRGRITFSIDFSAIANKEKQNSEGI